MAGYSATPLVKKLGIRENDVMRLINAPENYIDLLEILPPGVKTGRAKKDIDFVHLFVTDPKELSQLATLRNEIKKDGMIWVSWEKQSAGKKIKGAVNENLIREKALSLGLVDVKVCAVDEIWSGLKLVWRKENR